MKSRVIASMGAAVLACALAGSAQAGEAPSDDDGGPRNRFGDPFIQATEGVPGCPVPPGPLVTREEWQAQAHWRAERGTSCWRAGRCRLPNAYLYDTNIIGRARQAIAYDGRFGADTSVWLTGQRRWVTLQGCVRTPEQALALEQLLQRIDDVEAVINELQVLPAGGR